MTLTLAVGTASANGSDVLRDFDAGQRGNAPTRARDRNAAAFIAPDAGHQRRRAATSTACLADRHQSLPVQRDACQLVISSIAC